jgi:hypothetical protein
VPECVSTINVDAHGASGGDSVVSRPGGLGGRVQATLTVVPLSSLSVRVGGAGVLCTVSNTGGFNGGGAANCTGYPIPPSTPTDWSGTGGGATDLRVTPFAVNNRILVAGGGGGGGYWCGMAPDRGGAGGGLTGQQVPDSCILTQSGGGGSQVAGGAAGANQPTYGAASPGFLGGGGSGLCTGGMSQSGEGGGGGGGYYGGGGGCWAGGGGGSSYVTPTGSSSIVHTQGVRVGPGLLIISW